MMIKKNQAQEISCTLHHLKLHKHGGLVLCLEMDTRFQNSISKKLMSRQRV